MRAAWVLVLAGVVAGCGAPRTDEEICRAQAEDDPAVQALLLKATGNPHALLEDQDRMRFARQDAITACLRSRGVIPPGGVERQKPLR